MTSVSKDSFQSAINGEHATTALHGSQLIKNSLVTLALIGGLVVGTSICLIHTSGFSLAFAFFSITAYLFSSVIVLAKLNVYPHDRFGAANTITAIRAGITCLIGGALFETGWLVEHSAAWLLVAAAALTLCLDGVDGYVARHYGTNSEFGARYDMEVDAALILCLSILAFLYGKAGWWVIFIGGMRYLFVAAQYFSPRLQGKLLPSPRRQTICVLQIVCLGIILVPVVVPPVSTGFAILALMTLCYSFGRDIAGLLHDTPGSASAIEKQAR
ncbi:CDP-alcohol phosphatidyltransferase family protein [Phyllobacterium sp. SB3]|uniref:CDP-alcohol phosphatidyltransferase family protein n=1 Tax=Phyllobacterium sp. SB3 TaxID=3156073 RepID=UPI0032AF1B05